MSTELRQRQAAPLSRQLRQRVQVEHTLALLIVMPGIAAISLQALAHPPLAPNSSPLINRPDLPDRGIPAERRPAGMQDPCAEIEISCTPEASTHTPLMSNSSLLMDRPALPDRGIPTERKHAEMRGYNAKTGILFTPGPLMTDTGFSGQGLLKQLGQALPNLGRSIGRRQSILGLNNTQIP